MFSFLGRKKKLTDTVDTSAPSCGTEKHPEEEQADSKLRYALETVDQVLEPTKTARVKAASLRQHATSMRPSRAAAVKK